MGLVGFGGGVRWVVRWSGGTHVWGGGATWMAIYVYQYMQNRRLTWHLSATAPLTMVVAVAAKLNYG